MNIMKEGIVKENAEMLKDMLNLLVGRKDAILFEGKILELSKELDKLIVEQQLKLEVELEK